MIKWFITEFKNSFTVAIGKEEKEIDLFLRIVDDEYEDDRTYVIEVNGSYADFDDQENAEWFIEDYLKKLFNLDGLKIRASLLHDNELSINFYYEEEVILTTESDDYHAYSLEGSAWFSPIEQYTDYGERDESFNDLGWFDDLLDELLNI